MDRYIFHLSMPVSDLESARRFYVDVLGAEPLDRPGGAPPAVTIAGNTIDFFPADEEYVAAPGSRGQHHAFRIRLEDYDAWVDHLRGSGVPHELACHGPQRMSIYLEDPDGYHLELTLGIDAETGRQEIAKRGIKRYTIPGGWS